MKGKYKKETARSKANKAKYAALKRNILTRPISVVGKSMSQIRAIVNDSVKRHGETKYRAENIVPVPVNVPSGQAIPANCARMMPRLTQGVDDFQRIGNRIQPTHAKTRFNLNLVNPQSQLVDLTVHLAIFTVKGAFTDTAVAALPGNDFLRVGDGTNVDPTGPAGVPPISTIDMLNFVNNYPVNNERYNLKKWHKFIFKKGPNDGNGPVGTPNAPPTVLGAKMHQEFIYNWKPPTLKYDNNAAVLPTNHYPVYLIWATNNDGSALVANAVGFTVRTELFFKDQ